MDWNLVHTLNPILCVILFFEGHPTGTRMSTTTHGSVDGDDG